MSSWSFAMRRSCAPMRSVRFSRRFVLSLTSAFFALVNP